MSTPSPADEDKSEVSAPSPADEDQSEAEINNTPRKLPNIKLEELLFLFVEDNHENVKVTQYAQLYCLFKQRSLPL